MANFGIESNRFISSLLISLFLSLTIFPLLFLGYAKVMLKADRALPNIDRLPFLLRKFRKQLQKSHFLLDKLQVLAR